MDSQKIKTLVEAVRMGSLTKAAEELGYTQAGLTQMMNRLEAEMGISLLKRDKNGVTLTAEGERLMPQINEYIIASENLEKKIEEVKSGADAYLRIGTYTSILKTWLPEIINGFRELYPNVRLEIRDCDIGKIYGLVATAELDIGFSSRHTFTGCRFIKAGDDRFFAVLPKEEGTLFKNEVPISYFNGKNFIMPTFGFDPDVLSALNANGVKPVITATSVADSAVTELVEMGMGVSILPELVLKSIDCSGVVTKPISPLCGRELGLVVTDEKIKSPLVKKFISYSEQKVREYF